MSHSPRPHFLVVFLLLLVGILGSSPVLCAQTESRPASAEKPPASTAPQKPVHKSPKMIKIDDSIVRLAERSAPPAATPPAAEPLAQPQPVAEKAPGAATHDSQENAQQRESQITALEKQIKDKQQRVELLIRLFVADEQSFLRDPQNISDDPAVNERRKYEQDELKWEAAEVVRLRAKLDALKASP